MSTRSHIIKKLSDNWYKGIYCHFDGYLEGVGLILNKCYNSPDAIDKLLDLGDISILGLIPEDDPSLWIDRSHSKSEKCRSYKGRGEPDTEARFGKKVDFITYDYTYVWEDDHWEVYNWDEYLGRLDSLVANLEGV